MKYYIALHKDVFDAVDKDVDFVNMNNVHISTKLEDVQKEVLGEENPLDWRIATLSNIKKLAVVLENI